MPKLSQSIKTTNKVEISKQELIQMFNNGPLKINGLEQVIPRSASLSLTSSGAMLLVWDTFQPGVQEGEDDHVQV